MNKANLYNAILFELAADDGREIERQERAVAEAEERADWAFSMYQQYARLIDFADRYDADAYTWTESMYYWESAFHKYAAVADDLRHTLMVMTRG